MNAKRSNGRGTKAQKPATGIEAMQRVRVCLLERRSTDEDNQPYTIEAQDNKLVSYVDSQPGWTIVKRIEENGSGAASRRPKLDEAIRAARAGEYDVLLVLRVDRLSRRLGRLVDILATLDDAGVVFRSATEPFDTATPMGRMLVQMLGTFAEFEREVIVERVIDGMTVHAGEGKWSGRTPHGYAIDPTHRLVIDPDQAPVVQSMFRLYTSERHGTETIAGILNARGHRSGSGGPWSGKQIGRILTNRAYIGEINFRDVVTLDAHPAIIDHATFEAAGRIMEERGDEYARRASNPSDYMFTRMMRCPECGGAMTGTSARGRSRMYRYYTCLKRNRYGTDACAAPRMNADDFDGALLAEMRDFYVNRTDLIEQAVVAAQEVHVQGQGARTAERDTIAHDITKTRGALDRYFAAFENETMAPDVCAPRIATLTEKLKQLQERHEELDEAIGGEPVMPDPADLTSVVAHITDVISRDSPPQTKRLVEALVDGVSITGPDKVVPVFRVPQPTTSGKRAMAANDDGPASTRETGPDDQGAVRAPLHMVELRGLEPLTLTLPV